MLFCGCCAVRVEPMVCVWNRSASDAGAFAPYRSRMTAAHTRRAERRYLLEERRVRGEKERELWRESVDVEPALDRRVDVRDGVRERERELLHRVGTGLPNVVAADRDRVPAGVPLGAVRDEVG